MVYVQLLLIGGAIYMAVQWLSRRRARRRGHASSSAPLRPVRAVIWNGSDFRSYEAERDAAGVAAQTESGVIIYPFNVARCVEVPEAQLYVIGVERLPLANHEALEIGRRAIVFQHLFKSGGDLLYLLQMLAAIIPIAVTIYLVLNFSGVQGRLADLGVQTLALKKTLEAPLTCTKAP